MQPQRAVVCVARLNLCSAQVRVSRTRIVSCARKIMEQLGYVSAMVEIEFYGEVGTGLGPTLEFFSMLALELQSASLNMWRCPATVTRAELFPDGTYRIAPHPPHRPRTPTLPALCHLTHLQVSARRPASAASPTAASTTPSPTSSW